MREVPPSTWRLVQLECESASDESLTIMDGALYTSLHRMEQRGWIAAEWGVSAQGRRAKFYRLTQLGRKQLQTQTEFLAISAEE